MINIELVTNSKSNFNQTIDLIILLEANKKTKEQLLGFFTFNFKPSSTTKILVVGKETDYRDLISCDKFGQLLENLTKKSRKNLLKNSEILVEPQLLRQFNTRYKNLIANKKTMILQKYDYLKQIESIQNKTKIKKSLCLYFKLGKQLDPSEKLIKQLTTIVKEVSDTIKQDNLKIKKILIKTTMGRPVTFLEKEILEKTND